MVKMFIRDSGIVHYPLFYKKIMSFLAHFLEKIEAMWVVLLLCLDTEKRYLRW